MYNSIRTNELSIKVEHIKHLTDQRNGLLTVLRAAFLKVVNAPKERGYR